MKSEGPPHTIPSVTRRSAGREGRTTVRYRIVVRGEIRSPLVGPLEDVVVESTGEETSLLVDIVDQSHLQSVISSLSDRGIDIVSLGVEDRSRDPSSWTDPEQTEGWPI